MNSRKTEEKKQTTKTKSKKISSTHSVQEESPENHSSSSSTSKGKEKCDLQENEKHREQDKNETKDDLSLKDYPEYTDDENDSADDGKDADQNILPEPIDDNNENIYDTTTKSLKSIPKPVSPDKNEKSRPTSLLNKFIKYLKNPLILFAIISIISGISYGLWPSPNQSVSSHDIDWRSKVDPNNRLSNEDQNMIRASLKPILDKSLSTEDESLSTLLILSTDEDVAAKIARCLLKLVNKEAAEDKKSIEINLQSDSRNKADLDSYLRTSLTSSDPARAVLLRAINNIPSEHLLQRLRLLFGYCDGENPVIPNRLIILTASTTTENNLRETFKNNLPIEHDFVDALMSRISGHTIYIKNDQESIC